MQHVESQKKPSGTANNNNYTAEITLYVFPDGSSHKPVEATQKNNLSTNVKQKS